MCETIGAPPTPHPHFPTTPSNPHSPPQPTLLCFIDGHEAMQDSYHSTVTLFAKLSGPTILHPIAAACVVAHSNLRPGRQISTSRQATQHNSFFGVILARLARYAGISCTNHGTQSSAARMRKSDGLANLERASAQASGRKVAI